MKIRIFLYPIFTACILQFTGCVFQEVQETLYLGDVKIKAPITTPPMHLNVNSQPGDITFSPRFTAVNKENMLASSSEMFTGTFVYPDGTTYETSNKNIEWNYSQYSFGLDADIKLSNSFAFFGGFTISNDNINGWNIGLGLFSSMTEPIVRLDLGLNIQKYSYDAITVLDQTVTDFWGHETRNRYIYRDIDEVVNTNPFLTITFNSNNDSTLINYFFNVGYFLQQLMDFSPSDSNYDSGTVTTTTDTRPDCMTGFLYVNPGISLRLTDQLRIVLCAKFLKETILQLDSGGIIIVPGLQMDFTL